MRSFPICFFSLAGFYSGVFFSWVCEGKDAQGNPISTFSIELYEDHTVLGNNSAILTWIEVEGGVQINAPICPGTITNIQGVAGQSLPLYSYRK